MIYRKTNIQGENIKKQVDTMKNDITELIKKHKMQEDHQGSTIDEIHAQTKERLTTVRELHAQLLRYLKILNAIYLYEMFYNYKHFL